MCFSYGNGRILAQLLTFVDMTQVIFSAGYIGVSEPATVFFFLVRNFTVYIKCLKYMLVI